MHIQEVIDTFFLAAPALKTLKHISFFPYISNRKIVHTYYVASEIHLQIQFNSFGHFGISTDLQNWCFNGQCRSNVEPLSTIFLEIPVLFISLYSLIEQFKRKTFL